jgi:hypothetical protein
MTRGLWGYRDPNDLGSSKKRSRKPKPEILVKLTRNICSGRVVKVLLTIDGSVSSAETLQALIATVRPQETEVRILHVVELWPVHVHDTEWDRELSVARRAMLDPGGGNRRPCGEDARECGISPSDSG